MASHIPTVQVAPAAPRAEALGSIEALFQALADRTRLRILALLLTGEVCVCDIHESLELPQPKVSRHLAYLRRAGLVDGRKQGLWVHYRVANLTDPILRTIQDAVTHALSHVDELQQDTVRLAKRQNCAPLQPGAAPQCVCCSGT
jgi:ArsR family transcriptional regulator, arsenate/arsenite/antimonite-responsive transcriptional repressor